MNPNVLVAGVVSGLLYSLSGVALVVVYRASRLINFALGGMGALAAYLALEMLDNHLPYFLAYVVAIVAGALVSVATEWLVAQQVSGTAHIVGGLTTLGVLLLLQGVVVAVWGTETEALPVAFGGDPDIDFGPLRIPVNSLYILGVTALAIGALYLITYRTRLGLRMRASAEGQVTAALVGVDIRSVSRWSWVIGGVAGALAALLIVPATSLSPDSFTDFLFFGFAAVVIGGLTSVTGVIIGGVLFGVAVNLLETFLTTRLTNTLTLILVTAILLLRPQGILGTVERSVAEVKGLRATGFARRGRLVLRQLAQPRPALAGAGSKEQRQISFGSWRARTAVAVAGCVLLLVLPEIIHGGAQSVLPTFAGSILAVLGLTILYGVAGRVSVGNGAFLAVGAYTTAILMQHAGLPFLLAVVVAAVVSFGAGALIGLPALRIRSYVYFAAYTFMVANAVPELIDFFNGWTGGENGIALVPPARFATSIATMYWFFLAVTAVGIGAAALVLRSRLGRRWRAIRDSRDGAAAVGINIGTTTILAFAVSAALTGVGGALQGAAVGFLSPESYEIWVSIYLLVGAVIGGAGLISGAIVGAAFISFVPYLVGSGTTVSPDLLYGLAVIVVLILAPGGLVRALSSASARIARWLEPQWHAVKRVTGRISPRRPTVSQSSGADVVQPARSTAPSASAPAGTGTADRPRARQPQAPLLVTSSLAVDYDGLIAVHGVSLSVSPGEVITLLGPNGAGKSSVLRAIAGVARIREGSVQLAGISLGGLRPWQIARLGVSYVVEGRGIFPGLTASENLALGAQLSRDARSNIDGTRAAVYEIFPELSSRAGQLAGSLSGGQQQMLAIGRGLMARPRLLILDEPSLGLSPMLAQEVFARLQAMKATGMSMLVVEQNSALALELADWVYVIRDGQVQLSCDATEARRRENLIAEYLGVHTGGSQPV